MRWDPVTGRLGYRFPGLGLSPQADDTVKAVVVAFDLPEHLSPRQGPQWRPRLAAANAMLGLFAQLELPCAVCLRLANDASLRAALHDAPPDAFEPAWLRSPGQGACPQLAAAVTALMRKADVASASRLVRELPTTVAAELMEYLGAQQADLFVALAQHLNEQPTQAVATGGGEFQQPPCTLPPGPEGETPLDLGKLHGLRERLANVGLVVDVDMTGTGELSVNLAPGFLRAELPTDDLKAFFTLITGDASHMYLPGRMIRAMRSGLDAMEDASKEQAQERLISLFSDLVPLLQPRLAWAIGRRDLISAMALIECLLDMEAAGVVVAGAAIDACLGQRPPVAQAPLSLEDWITGEEAVSDWLNQPSCPLGEPRKDALRKRLSDVPRQLVELCGDMELAALIRFAGLNRHHALAEACVARLAESGMAGVQLQVFEEEGILLPGWVAALAALSGKVRSPLAALRFVDEFTTFVASSRFEGAWNALDVSRTLMSPMFDMIRSALDAIDTPAQALGWVRSVQTLLRALRERGASVSGIWFVDCDCLLAPLRDTAVRLLMAEPRPARIEAQQLASWLMVCELAERLLSEKSARADDDRLSDHGAAAEYAACWTAWHGMGGLLMQVVELLCAPSLLQHPMDMAAAQAMGPKVLKGAEPAVVLALLAVAPLPLLPCLRSPDQLPELLGRVSDVEGVENVLMRWGDDPGMVWLPERVLHRLLAEAESDSDSDSDSEMFRQLRQLRQVFPEAMPPRPRALPFLLRWRLQVLQSSGQPSLQALSTWVVELNAHGRRFAVRAADLRTIGAALNLGADAAAAQQHLSRLTHELASPAYGVWLLAGWLEQQVSDVAMTDPEHAQVCHAVVRWLNDRFWTVSDKEWREWVESAKRLQSLVLA